MVFVNIIFFVFEILIVSYLLYMIKNSKRFTLKSTLIYPALVLLSLLVILSAKLAYDINAPWYISLLDSCEEAIKILALDINSELLVILIEKNTFVLIVYVGLIIVSALSLASFTFILFKSIILNFFKIKYFKKELTYIFGFNENAKTYIQNLDICKSENKNDSNHKQETVLILKKTELRNYIEEKIFLNQQNVKYKIFEMDNQKQFFQMISKLSKHLSEKKYNFISFYDTDKEIHEFITWTQAYLKENNLYTENNIQFIVKSNFKQKEYINELIKGNPSGTFLNSNGKEVPILDESRGKIRSFNKYDMIAYKFLWENNLAKYFPNDFINDDCTIKENVNINLYVLGFGKVNQSVLRDVLINTQFVRKTYDPSKKNYTIFPVRMNVHIYDDHMKMLDWEFSNGFMKYRKENYKNKKENYFDLTEDYFSHITFHFNKHTNEEYFISSLYDEINAQSGKHKNIVNYFLISLGSDFENSFIATKIKESLVNVTNVQNQFFVRTRDGLSLPNKDNSIIYFGNDKDILSYDNIVADKVYLAAKLEGCKYAKLNPTEENLASDWSSLSMIQQKSNLYSIASVPFKLSLLKCDFLNMDEEAFKEKYQVNERREKCVETHTAMLTGTNEFYPVDILAFAEHERWNAFEISQGVLPMKKSLFHELNTTKNENELYHINLCSDKGLLEYHAEGNKDVIHYDYDIIEELITHAKQVGIKETDVF